ncbi:hypothetical protein KR084_001945, partial [Drosophila pseudotakahashii]
RVNLYIGDPANKNTATSTMSNSQENEIVSPASPDSFETPHGSGNVTPVVETISTCKLPAFWKQHVPLWFLQVEAQFQCNRITSDNTRYYHLLSALDVEVMSEVSDVLAQPPDSNKYEHLKSI